MAACLLFFAFDTLHWPLVGDAVSVHYLIFLMQHGMAPYRQIVDAQMPGTYLVDWAVVHVFGGGVLGLRLFDFSLMAAAIVAMVAITWPTAETGGAAGDERWVGMLAGGLFALVHGRDGIPQTGQRDLIMAVLLLSAYACTFHAVRRRLPWLSVAAGFCASTAVTIKPTVLPAAFAVFVIALVHLWRSRQPLVAQMMAMLAGVLLPLAAVAIFLLHYGAWSAFLDAATGLMPHHATLQRRSLAYLLGHCLSPVGVLLPILLACLFLRRSARRTAGKSHADARSPSWESIALYCGCLLALLSYILQGKGFPYHRYPFLAFFLLIAMRAFGRALQGHRDPIETMERPSSPVFWRWVAGAAGLCAAALVLAPLSAYKLSRYEWGDDEDFRMMSTDLAAVGGASLSGRVQCIDAFAGCINTLYRMGVVQSTGFLVDFYWLTPNTNAVVERMREQFWEEIQQNPPQVFVVTKMVFPIDAARPDTYDKLKLWPRFDQYLNTHYDVAAERQPTEYVLLGSHPERPAGYRIYVRRHE